MNCLKNLRKKLGFTFNEMGAKTGILPQTLWAIEAKKYNFSLSTLIKLKQSLKLDWSELGKMIEEEFKE